MGTKTTVMGPEELNSPGDPLIAPKMSTKTDKYQYRRDVRLWYEYVFSSADSGHNKAKGIAANLGRSLYAQMDQRYKRIIDAASDRGTVRFRNRDGTRLTEPQHVKCVESILDIVAKDSPTDRVRRLVRMNKSVFSCKRNRNESYPQYATRFQSLAQAYLSYANACANGQDEQNFAMLLIENAGLDLTTYNNVIKELVSDAKENEIDPSLQIKFRDLKEVREQATKVKAMIPPMRNKIPHDHEEGAISTMGIDVETFMKLDAAIEQTCVSIDELDLPEDDKKLRERLHMCISIDKAVLALQDIKTSTDESSGHINEPILMGNDDTPPSRNPPQKFGTMISGARYHDDKSKNRYFANKRKSNRNPNNRNDSDGYHNDRQYHRRDSSHGYNRDYRSHNHDPEHQDKSRSVHDRIGKRRDYDERKKIDDEEIRKRVRFNEQGDDRNEEPYRGDPYFRREVRHSSNRT